MPFNGSKFNLEGKYKEVFYQQQYQEEDKEKASENQKYYKIKYTLNILPACTYENNQCQGVSELLDKLGETQELDVFTTQIV